LSTGPDTETLLLFPSILHVTRHMDADALNAALKTEIKAVRNEVDGTPPKELACTLYSTMASAPDLHRRAGFEAVASFVTEEAHSYADAMDYGISGNGTEIQECWLNIMGPGDSCDLFNDSNSVVSGVYFVNAAAGGARLQFHAPSADEMIIIQKSEVTDLNAAQIFFDGEAGDLVLFPSYLMRSWTLHDVPEEQVLLLFTVLL
jgi:uncharacterized protein (TIGR02466 family)